jgi:hypothetical protein
MQRFRLMAVTVVSAALLVPLAVYGRTGLAGSSSAAQYQYKITICHHTHSARNPGVTISVSVNAWPAHQRHGDTIGACQPPKVTNTAAPTGATTGSNSDDGAQGGNGNDENGKAGNGHGKGEGGNAQGGNGHK